MTFRDKLTKIDTLRLEGATPGERAAAEAARERLLKNPPVRITATVLDIDRDETFYNVTYVDLDGATRTKRIPKELFRTPTKVVDILNKAYADLPDDSAAAVDLVKQTIELKSDRKLRVTSKSGWFDHDNFVYPGQTFGPLAGTVLHAGSNEIDPAFGLQKGTLEGWREGLTKSFKCSDFLIFSCCVSAASALLDVVGEDEGAIFHLHGVDRTGKRNPTAKTKSSSGKSLCTRSGASTTGRCKKTDLVTFAATVRSVEDYCFARNHVGAQFDEEGRSLGSGTGPRISAAEMAYMVPGGRGGLRSNKATRDVDLGNVTWALFAMSNGENPLDDLKTPRAEGAQVRMISIPVPPGSKGGIFNRIKGTRAEVIVKGQQQARQVEDTIETNFGVVMPALLQKLVQERPKLASRVRQLVDKFVTKVGGDTDPWERRYAEKFGFAFAAAVLLSEWGIGPWTKKRARVAIRTIYKKARTATASVDEAADALTRKIRKLVKTGERFPVIGKGQSVSEKCAVRAWGATRTLAQVGRVVLVPYSRVERLVRPSAITGQVLQKLASEGVVLKASDGKLTREAMIKGLIGAKRRRYVCIKLKALKARNKSPKPGDRPVVGH